MKKILTVLFFFVLSLPAAAQLSGTYYIGGAGTKPGGGNPDFATVKAAVDSLNASGVSGPCIFYLTESKTYTESADISLGCTGTSETNKITFKPSTGVTAIIDLTLTTNAGGSSIDGHWVIGSPTQVNTNLVPTNYVIIDGSNTESGTTRDLTIRGSATSSQKSVFRIFGNNDNITIKNCIIVNRSTSGNATAAIMVTHYVTNAPPDNFVAENDSIIGASANGAMGVQFSVSGSPAGGCTGATIRNCYIFARATRAIMYNYVSDGEISGNTISHDCQLGTGAAATIYLTTGTSSAGTVNIFNNKIVQAKIWNTTAGPSASNGIIGIDNQYASPKVVNIYNNFITGFSIATSTVQGVKIYGIRQTGSSTTNVYYNTIVIPEMTNMTVRSGYFISGIAFASAAATEASPGASAVMNVKNNIVITNETAMKTFCIRRAGSTGTFTSNNNNLYYTSGADSGYAGFYNGTNNKTISDWQSASSQDAHSKSVAVTFTSATDLSLAGGSIGDNNLVGTPLSSPYDKDIEGDSRNSTYPYMGADEKSTLIYPLAMHTVTMSASVNNATAFGNNGLLGTDGGAQFYAHWDASYLYLGWSGGRTNYSSDLFYAAIDTDPDGINGTSSAIDNIDFLSGSPSPDFYVVYENNSAYYGSPVTNGNAFEVYNVSGGNWNWVSRTDGNDNISSKIIFDDSNGEVRLRVAWSTLGVTPSASTKLGLVMWNNNGSANYMWARVPGDNPSNGSTPKTLTHGISFSSTGIGVNPSSSGSNYWLPVELTSFTAVSKGNNVELQWKTATETNNAGFEVERRLGSEWVKVGFVEGAGTSNTIKEYRYSDVVKANGSIGYRLKQIDRTGAFTYSNVVEVVVAKGPESFTLGQNYPNPFNPTTTINFSVPQTEHATLKVFDITGKEVTTLFNETAQSGQTYNVQFNANGLASGMYLYVLQTPTNRVVKKMLLMK
ncbi:MAG: T9SS type A sorting domain-containing protein [Bacteroidetes bacterium]|nr:T9SS type A sorting domain-containing protein [Bacteroidota bacterium]